LKEFAFCHCSKVFKVKIRALLAEYENSQKLKITYYTIIQQILIGLCLVDWAVKQTGGSSSVYAVTVD